MADSSEKTEDPTGKKIEDARKKGQLARSRELSTTLVLIVSAFISCLWAGGLLNLFLNLLRECSSSLVTKPMISPTCLAHGVKPFRQ